MDFSKDGNHLLTGSQEKLLRVFDLENTDSGECVYICLFHGYTKLTLHAFVSFCVVFDPNIYCCLLKLVTCTSDTGVTQVLNCSDRHGVAQWLTDLQSIRQS